MKKSTLIVIAVAVIALALLAVLAWSITRETPPTTDPSGTDPSNMETTFSTEATDKTEPSSEATEPSTEPTDPVVVYTHPFTGEILDEPFAERVYVTMINNSKSALPHHGLNQADIVFEMLTNQRGTRCMALVTDIESVDKLGPIRSVRVNFVDIAQAYDGLLTYAGGSSQALKDLKASELEYINAIGGGTGGAFYRDQERLNSGYAREHTLFTSGQGLRDCAQKFGFSLTAREERSYGFAFRENGTPDNGETANSITMSFFTGNKTTTMRFDASTGKYIYHQYGKDMIDGNTGEFNSYTNVFTLFADTHNEGIYHIANLLGEGDGYYACGGKIVPIKWRRNGECDPFIFTLTDGTPLEQGVGNSYVGIIPTGSAFSYE